MIVRWIRHEPGNWHVGVWFSRQHGRRAWSVRLGWWAIIGKPE